MTGLDIKIATAQAEIEAAQKLRFEVFNLEMGKGLQASYRLGLDVDEFDALCDHLIVRDASLGGRVVGTYRLLLGSKARGHFGFYSEREFNLDELRKLPGEMLELGRTCVHKDYRDRPLIDLMWQAIAAYVRTHQVKYLFGCASLPTIDPHEVSECFAALKKRYYAPAKFRVYPLVEKSFSNLVPGRIDSENSPALFSRLPPLIKGYLRLGALLCGPPAIDLEFGTTDLFVLLDIETLSSEYQRHFGFAGPKVRSAVR